MESNIYPSSERECGGEQGGIQSPSLTETKYEQWLAANSYLTATVWKSAGSPLKTVTFHCSTSSFVKLLSPLIIMLLRDAFGGVLFTSSSSSVLVMDGFGVGDLRVRWKEGCC